MPRMRSADAWLAGQRQEPEKTLAPLDDDITIIYQIIHACKPRSFISAAISEGGGYLVFHFYITYFKIAAIRKSGCIGILAPAVGRRSRRRQPQDFCARLPRRISSQTIKSGNFRPVELKKQLRILCSINRWIIDGRKKKLIIGLPRYPFSFSVINRGKRNS